MKDVVVSIGMGIGQLDFVKRLHELGFAIIAFGKGKNSKEAMALCEYTAEIDTRDFAGAVEWIDSLAVRVIAVGSYAGGEAVYTVQQLANYYRVCTSIPDVLLAGTGKVKQQTLYKRYGLSSIKTWRAKEISQEMLEVMNINSFVIKPSVGRGSEGISIVNKNKLISLLGGLDEEDIIQEFKEGREYRCVIMVQNGILKLIAPILRKSYRNTVFLGILSYSVKDIDCITAFFCEFIKKTGIQNTIIKSDIIVSDKEINVIEMDIGVGGGYYYKTFISRIYDRSLMDDYISLINHKEIKPYVAKRPSMKMEYVFNHSCYPVTYDLDECQHFYENKFGKAEIQVNKLHPEKKGGFSSNADFIFAVMHECCSEKEEFVVDDCANECLLHEVKDI